MNRNSYANAVFYYSYGSCAYIDGCDTKFNYAAIESCSQEFYNELLLRGWRRFGEMFFAPFCDDCQKCISIRQVIDDFNLSPSHKRVLKNNANTRFELRTPTYSIEKLELYNKYHSFMNIKKGWDYNPIDKDKYVYMFIDGHLEFGKEICYYVNEHLVGVAFVDILENTHSMSAIYFFYDHNYVKLSLGTFSILKQIEISKILGIKYLYPGYWIQNHYSLGYKERFKPFEFLANRPNIYEMPIWKQYKGEI